MSSLKPLQSNAQQVSGAVPSKAAVPGTKLSGGSLRNQAMWAQRNGLGTRGNQQLLYGWGKGWGAWALHWVAHHQGTGTQGTLQQSRECTFGQAGTDPGKLLKEAEVSLWARACSCWPACYYELLLDDPQRPFLIEITLWLCDWHWQA